MSFFRELNRRNVLRVGLAYVLVAWLALQGMDFALQIVAGPPRILGVFRIVAVAGLPLVLILSWLFAFTPEGVRREPPFGQSPAAPPRAHRRLDRLITAALAAVAAILLADHVMPERSSGAGIGETPDPKAQEALGSASAPETDAATENPPADAAQPKPAQPSSEQPDPAQSTSEPGGSEQPGPEKAVSKSLNSEKSNSGQWVSELPMPDQSKRKQGNPESPRREQRISEPPDRKSPARSVAA